MLLVMLLAVVVAGRGTAAAENLGPGGGTRIIAGDEVVGPYRLFITSSPEPAVVGQITYVVRAADPRTGARFRDLTVSMELRNPANGTALTDTLTHEKSGGTSDYAAHLTIEQAGAWEGTIRVTGPQGDAEVEFLQRVAPPRTGMTLLVVGLPFLAVLAVLGGLWYARGGQKRSADTATPGTPEGG